MAPAHVSGPPADQGVRGSIVKLDCSYDQPVSPHLPVVLMLRLIWTREMSLYKEKTEKVTTGLGQVYVQRLKSVHQQCFEKGIGV